MNKPKVITLCGSTRFKDEFEQINKELTLQGFIVLSVGCFVHQDDTIKLPESTKPMLDSLHKRKIDMSDAIYVINKGGYIGESTRSEIIYAHNQGKQIFYYENHYVNFEITIDELEAKRAQLNNLKPKTILDKIRYFFRHNDMNYRYCRKCGGGLKQDHIHSTFFGWKITLKCNKCGNIVEKYDNSKIE